VGLVLVQTLRVVLQAMVWHLPMAEAPVRPHRARQIPLAAVGVIPAQSVLKRSTASPVWTRAPSGNPRAAH
jgi:hypothetical protein